MSDCKVDLATHKKPGRTQIGRDPKALDRKFIKIDERSIEDLIVSTCKMSYYINYYNADNTIIGKWDRFFAWESTSILAQISSLDIQELSRRYKLLRKRLVFTPTSGHLSEAEKYFNPLKKITKDLVTKTTQLPADLQVKEYFRSTVPILNQLLETVISQIYLSEDLKVLFSNHLFNKKIQNLMGLLLEWKKRAHKQLYKNLENYPKHTPQYSLFLTFLRLFENAQSDLNGLVKKHLDFYYKDILRLEPQEAKPDYVHCCIEPYEGVEPFKIPKNSVFLAGKDGDGNKRYYAATSDVVVNQARIHSIFGGLKKEGKYYFDEFTNLNAKGDSWSPLNPDTIGSPLGSIFASPLLFLKGGIRDVNLTFKDAVGKNLEININDYKFFLSGEEGWFEVAEITGNEDNVRLELKLTADDPSIIPFDSELHEGISIKTKYPVLKVQGKDGQLSNFSYNSCKIEVKVEEYKQFKLFSNAGTIDHTKSFEPFGLVPKNGYSITFACKEFFLKNRAKGNLIISAEPGGSSDWSIYENTKLKYLYSGNWREETAWKTDEDYLLDNTAPIGYNTSEEESFKPSDNKGFLKIFLDDDDYAGEAYLNKFISESKEENPNLPYVPTINEFKLNYTANSDYNDVDIFNIFPKGYEKISGSNKKLIPVFQNDGEIFIGIKDIQKGNSLGLLFQLSEGSANPRQEAVEPVWRYLDGNNWEDFKAEEIGDETDGLTKSGIVQLKAPEGLNTTDQTRWPRGIWWLKIEIPERVDAICKFVGVHAQALKAVLFDHEGSGLEFKNNIEGGVITKLLKPLNEIKKIEQPYMSFGGRLSDTDRLFYQRTSERLRHKERSISTWDYETLVLDNFPEVFRVKCLNHYRYDSASIHNSSAGYITIIPVAKGLDKEVPLYWKPILDLVTMKQIKAYLENKSSPHARINVKPPNLESLELVFNVKYHELPGADTRFYTQELTNTINSFLSPWAYSSESKIEFQSEIDKSKLIQLIEAQSFVDYISGFKVNHHILDETTSSIAQSYNDVDVIIPKTVYSLFVPHKQSIQPITNTCCA
jgi:hypothetical protein